MTGRIVVVGLGPAGSDLVTAGARDLIDGAEHRYLRTAHHPAAGLLTGADTFDAVYEAGVSLREVYDEIVRALLGHAARLGRVLYAVPGSPDVAERTVELLRARAEAGDVDLEVHPAVSFVDLVWARLGIDPIDAGVRIVDGQRFAAEAAGERGPLLVAQCDSRAVLSDVKLSVDEAPEEPVVLLQRLGLPDEQIRRVAWDDLDREIEPDHLTSLLVPQLEAPVAGELQRLSELVATLRRQCPWDREQTHRSLIPHVIEETYELVDAIERTDSATGSGDEHLEEELGDLLFQVVFHATIAEQEGRFTLADVARGIHDKLYERHPHVFGDAEAETPDDVRRNWERIKQREKGRASVMDGVPETFPALLLSLKLQKKAATVGLVFPSAEEAYRKVEEELAEVRLDPSEREVGDLLFAASGAAFVLGVDPEHALRRSAGRFRDRVRQVEQLAADAGLDPSSVDQEILDRLWDDAKRLLAGPDTPSDPPTGENR